MIWFLTIAYFWPPIWAYWRGVERAQDFFFTSLLMVWILGTGWYVGTFTTLTAIKWACLTFSGGVELVMFVIVWSDV